MGTYVTRLSPCALINNQFIPIHINPLHFPKEYQDVMEYTLRQLISSERYLLFYFSPYSAPGNCPEVYEWQRYHFINQALSGQPHDERVVFYGNHPLNPSLPYIRSVINQRNFYQESGSCAIFSLKSVVFSVIGPSLGAMHTSFMQLHNASALLYVIESKIKALQHYLVQPVAARISNNRSFVRSHYSFFNPQETEQLDYPEFEEINGSFAMSALIT